MIPFSLCHWASIALSPSRDASLTGSSGSVLDGGGILTVSVTVTNSTITDDSLTGGSGSVLDGGGILADRTLMRAWSGASTPTWWTIHQHRPGSENAASA